MKDPVLTVQKHLTLRRDHVGDHGRKADAEVDIRSGGDVAGDALDELVTGEAGHAT